MVLPMSRPAQHPQTGVYLFRQRVPQDLKDKLRGKPLRITVAGEPVEATHGSELKFSLRTKDVAEARQRHREASAQVEAFWKAARNGPIGLSQKQVHALAGTLYETLTKVLSENPGTTERWDLVLTADALPGR